MHIVYQDQSHICTQLQTVQGCDSCMTKPGDCCTHLVDVAGVQPDGVARLGASISEAQEVIRYLRRASNLCGTSETQHEQVQHQAVVLHDKGSKLQTPDQPIGVGVSHVLIGNHNVVLGCDVVSNVVVQHQTQQPASSQSSVLAGRSPGGIMP